MSATRFIGIVEEPGLAAAGPLMGCVECEGDKPLLRQSLRIQAAVCSFTPPPG